MKSHKNVDIVGFELFITKQVDAFQKSLLPTLGVGCFVLLEIYSSGVA